MYSKDLREATIKMYTKRNISLRELGDIIDVHYSTISRWKNYEPKERKIRERKLEGIDITEAIKLFILNNPFCSLEDIKNKIYQVFQIDISLELVRLFLKKNNITKKRARYYSKPSNDEIKLVEFLVQREEYVKEERIFVSIDETSFGRNYQPAYGYSEKGVRLNVKKPTTRITTKSMITAVSPSDNSLYYSYKEGSTNTEIFINFLKGLDYPSKTVLIMDNVSFHHSKKVREFVETKQWEILYVPPYSPIFNPIEGVFSIIKRHYQKYMNIEDSLQIVTDTHLKSFFRQSFNAISRF